jgi:hypothetical protein
MELNKMHAKKFDVHKDCISLAKIQSVNNTLLGLGPQC